MIEVRNLSKIFWDRRRGRVNAVDDISFTGNPGEIFGLLGPNGAGKTTALRVLSTVLKPTTGTATVAGHDVVREAQKVRESIGFISGSTGVYEKLTPEEMVAYFGQLHGMSKERVRQRTEEIFSLLEMHDFARTINGKLSSGMRQKVSIARAIVHDPPVLIFDEPTVSLDVLVARTVINFIRLCREQGKCVILSTHIMGEAEKLCDRIAIILRGKIVVQGNMEELRRESGFSDLEAIFFSFVKAEPGGKYPA